MVEYSQGDLRLKLVSIVCLFALAAVAAPPEGKNIWEGVYTDAQAARGEAVYSMQCSRCHRDDLSGEGGILIGSHFMQEWSEDSLVGFYKALRRTMPANAPGSLSEPDYLAIVAYVLRKNEFPSGGKELTADAVPAIRVEGKDGPAPVPDFSLVEVVGCLSQQADGSWMVTNASEPVRTRDPKDSPAEALSTLKAKPGGAHTFTLLDFSGVQENPLKNQKVEVKGFLIRKPGDDRINPSSVLKVSPVCGGK
jgi:mono/diheme cytochrome c family protein